MKKELEDYLWNNIFYVGEMSEYHRFPRNDKHNVHTEYFTLRLIDSEKNPFAKDLKFEWVTLKN